MIVIPAIDLIQGKPVRLYQGDYAKKKVVADSAMDTALTFEKEGAQRLHLVDLDGAKAGHPVNDELIDAIAAAIGVPVEVGGGIRTMDDISTYLDHGIDTVILGTAAIINPSFLKQAVEKYGAHITLGLDCRNGYAMTSGWLEDSRLYFTNFAKEAADAGVRSIIYTDISKDGTLKGPAFDQLAALQKAVPDVKITASGGIHNLEDIKKLKEMGIAAAITGQAIYSGSLNLSEAIALTKEKS